jgi:hypothetical protein
MGSLALAGAIGGFGKGMTEDIERKAISKEKNLDRLRDERLQTMRDTSAMARQTESQEFVTGQAETLREQQLTDVTAEQEYQASLVAGTQAREDVVREDEQEQERDIQAMKMWQERTESTSYTSKDGKWQMQIITDTVEGPSGLPVEQDRLVVREPGTPVSYVQHGLTMVPDNYTNEERDKALTIANSGDERLRKAKEDLLGKAGTAQDDSSVFMEAYGFLPAAYFRKIRQTEEGSGGAYQQFRQSFRQPVPQPESLPPLGTRQPGVDDTEFLKPGLLSQATGSY